MRLKSYVKTIEDENYILRQKIEELDSRVTELNTTIDDMSLQVGMTLTTSLTDGIDDFFTEVVSTYASETDAISDIAVNMCHTISNHIHQTYGAVYRKEKVEKCLDIKLHRKWTIKYWYLGMRFQKVSINLLHRKKHFIKVFISNYDKKRNFVYTEVEDEERMGVYTNHTPEYYKKTIYDYINSSNYKSLFTPYK